MKLYHVFLYYVILLFSAWAEDTIGCKVQDCSVHVLGIILDGSRMVEVASLLYLVAVLVRHLYKKAFFFSMDLSQI